mgnify:CR=1 FL=1
MININPFDIQQILEICFEWIVWILKILFIYFSIMLSGVAFGIYFEQGNIAQLEVCAAKLEAAQKNKRSPQ